MFCVTVVEGSKKGRRFDIAAFPFVIGNNTKAELTLTDPGVWPDHIALELPSGTKGPQVSRLGEGTLSVNSEPTDSAALRNGDLLSVGAALLRFGVAPPKRKSLLLHNTASWMAIATIVLLELILILFLKNSESF